ncbi:hypothetical protein EGI26_07985 [Lacihabitans sp. CCS-44]|nr:hypothetical protein [Lacihabitans sp. CCS-44]
MSAFKISTLKCYELQRMRKENNSEKLRDAKQVKMKTRCHSMLKQKSEAKTLRNSKVQNM